MDRLHFTKCRPNIFPLNYLPPPPEIHIPIPATYDEQIASEHTPLIIDNGASTLRFGWASWDAPRCAQNAVSKYKERRQNKQLLLFGEAIDSESGARAQSKTPWEGDILVNMDALVRIYYVLEMRTVTIVLEGRKTRLIMRLYN